MRRLATMLAVVLAAAGAGCGGAREPSRPAGPNQVVMTEYRFSPRDARVRRGVELTVRNDGQIAHDLTLEDPRTGKRLLATDTFLGGLTRKLRIDVPPGRYTMVCTVPGHAARGMTGTLTVRRRP